MKGNVTLEINQTTMVEAMQQYFDAQLAKTHLVKSVKADTGGNYNNNNTFKVELAEVEPADQIGTK